MRCIRRLGVFVMLALATLCSCGGGGVSTPLPSPDFSPALSTNSLALLPGTTSVPVSISIAGSGGFNGAVSVAISGLPAGVAASPPLPFTIAVGSSQSMTLSAGPSSMGDFNVSFQFTSGSLVHSIGISLHINVPPNSTLRSTYVRVDDSPYSLGEVAREIVYDPQHKHLFVTVPYLNQVDVLSSTDGSRVGSVAVPLPLSVDISQDGTRVYVGTGVQEVDVVDTKTLELTRIRNSGLFADRGVEGMVLTSNGKALLSQETLVQPGGTITEWDPSTNNLTSINGLAWSWSYGPHR